MLFYHLSVQPLLSWSTSVNHSIPRITATPSISWCQQLPDLRNSSTRIFNYYDANMPPADREERHNDRNYCGPTSCFTSVLFAQSRSPQNRRRLPFRLCHCGLRFRSALFASGNLESLRCGLWGEAWSFSSFFADRREATRFLPTILLRGGTELRFLCFGAMNPNEPS